MRDYATHLWANKRATDLAYARKLLHDAPGRTSYSLAAYMPRFLDGFICKYEWLEALEAPYELDLGQGRVFTCTPDAVYVAGKRTLFVDDYKTERWIRTDQDVRESFQARTYSLALAEKYGFSEVTFRFYNLRFRVERVVDFSPEELTATKTELLAVIRDLEADTAFAPTPCDACDYCPIAKGCPAGKRVPLDGDPATFAESLIVRDKQLSDDKKQLKAFLKKSGAVPIGNGKRGKYELIPTVKKSLTASRLREYFKVMEYSEEDALRCCVADLRATRGFLKSQGKLGELVLAGLGRLIEKKTSLTMRYLKKSKEATNGEGNAE